MWPHPITLLAMPRTQRDIRLLLPRDYLLDPHQFGRHPHPRWQVPPGGDQRSLQVAMVLHAAALVFHQRKDSHRARRVGQRFEFSKQRWSECMLGHRWPGETVLAAVISEFINASG